MIKALVVLSFVMSVPFFAGWKFQPIAEYPRVLEDIPQKEGLSGIAKINDNEYYGSEYWSSTEYDETRMRAVGMEYRCKDFLDSNLASREIYIRAIAKF